MAKKLFSTNAAYQRQRILAWLLTAPLNTYQARQELDVFHPSARVQELKEVGHKIITHWTSIETPLGKHRIAEYVLLHGGSHE
ncbi:MAG: helix-turn-helix domain-containing protein [Methylococcaceae bacterium]|nr:helix-turn-helix domain-containing protein [Methylococcaceae bacterium]